MEDEPAPKRVRLNDSDFEKLSKEDLVNKWKKQEAFITALENKTDLSHHNAAKLSEMEDRLHQHQIDAAQKQRKDGLLVMRLATKEQELQELATQLSEMTKGQAPGSSQLRSALLDPALNLIFQRMKKELDDKTKALQQAQDDMSAWKFNADSQMGKRLMSRCRTLIQENQELGKQVSAGRTAQLETELALQKKYSEELKRSQDELNEFVIDLDEEVVGMQSTICALQQQLKEAKQELQTFKQTPQKPTVAATSAMPPPESVEEPVQRTIKEERTELTIKAEKKDEEKEWTQQDDTALNEPSRQSGEANPSDTSWAAYDKAAGEKSPSTPTEEEAFRIPEAPKTVDMAPISPAIPEEASAAPGPQEEARTSSSTEEQPMDVDTSWIKKEKSSEKERRLQVTTPPNEQVNFRTSDAIQPPASSLDEMRTQEDNMEKASSVETPMETEPVQEPRAAQELLDNQIKTNKMEQADRTADAAAEPKSGEMFHHSLQGVEDSNVSAIIPNQTSNGNTRIEENNQGTGIETGPNSNHTITKNGECSPATPMSPPPQSSNSHNQIMLKSNCNNSPSDNNIEEDGPSQQSTEDGTVETNSSDTLHNNDSVASDIPATDRTNSPVKQVVVKSNDGDSLTGGGDGDEKRHHVISDVPPLKENGPDAVSN